ncbi:hypothetical protein BDP27DRAFT_1289191 [Rhodocollybia butyracea]|uniref:Uncharacterized protein n=1 Tax=Rhodocollybia butyracea TaxID=206335 RepID=A0A9P5Q1H6_9AGAR|nr:hypothetical protein BDP27DRAFT_298001 [Rhodocollybia butyracea]KAF9073333.1 hypothetical protein BDP27DRAFT_1289191 [Rhodocollybia butyracea]
MSAIFTNGQTLTVTTRGPGNLSLCSYQSNGGIVNHVGATNTANEGVTRFVISHSYTFERFAFYWDGEGEAVYNIGTALANGPVGRSWAEASGVSWGATTVGTVDATDPVSSAVVRNGAATCFVIPPVV